MRYIFFQQMCFGVVEIHVLKKKKEACLHVSLLLWEVGEALTFLLNTIIIQFKIKMLPQVSKHIVNPVCVTKSCIFTLTLCVREITAHLFNPGDPQPPEQ